MKFQIKHECRGRIRVQAVQQRMTLEQADMLEAWLLTLPQVECASVHERTRCAVIEYQGDRKDLLRILAGFSYQDHALAELVPVHSSRALNRAYEEKLVGMVAFKAVRSLFFPAPLRAVYTVIRSAPYLFRALRCLLRRQLHVELLDGISVCLSMVRRDFDTASSVMFLLRLGELLEEWTHKKSVENLARSMSLNIDRVWMKTESGEELVPLHQVQAGDQVVIRMGGMIPLDGTIAEGEVMLNQASLTGESIPVPKRPGSSVYAGTVVEEGECVLTVTQQSGKGRYDKIVAMIEESEQLKSTAENHAAHLADRLVPYTLAGSVLVYLLTRNVTRALSVLMVDFSCALKLSMPLAVLSAMSEASRFHVTVKGGKYLEAVAQVVERHNLLVLSDEIYAALTYGSEPHTAFSAIPGMQERTILVNGFSKSHSMTGWRMGYAAGPKEIISLMTKLHQFAIMSAPTMSQYAAVEALRNGDDDVVEMREAYNQRRRYLMYAFKEMGLPCFEPYGAFYVFPCIREFGMTSDEFATRFLQEEKVAVVPGTAFGDCGEGFIRISYAYSLENLKVAIGRLADFVARLKKEQAR